MHFNRTCHFQFFEGATHDLACGSHYRRHLLLGQVVFSETLRLVNDHDPKPLRYQLMAERPDMFAWEPEEQGLEQWVIRIRKIAAE